MIEHDILYLKTSIPLPETLTWKMASKDIDPMTLEHVKLQRIIKVNDIHLETDAGNKNE